ncbi:copper-binding protein [Caldimonas sp. KR1-144]|uniref:copper-binding protein n=1 Tax=Caldimonas sp. KR1-144 TaxID=3400911 RepID=UPI003C0EC1F7
MTRIARKLAALAALAAATIAAHAQTTDGEVRKIDKAQAKITLKHGEIKNLEMPAMTMVYRVKDPAVLETLQVGDKVKFHAEKVGGQYTVTEIRKP